MFDDARKGRGFISEKQIKGPLTHEEIAAAVRGRHRWNINAKRWEIYYQPYRKFWIVLLLTVNDRIFAMPMQRIIPTKIYAQFELEEMMYASNADLMQTDQYEMSAENFHYLQTHMPVEMNKTGQATRITETHEKNF